MGLVSAEVQKEFDRLKERIDQLQTMLGKVAAFIQPGTPVWYESSPLRRYAAVVDSVPREIGGDGQWCVRLRDLDEAYQQSHTTNRTTVSAAATWCLSPREAPMQAADAKVEVDARAADEVLPGLGRLVREGKLVSDDDDGKRGTQTVPHETQQGAATPDQGEGSAIGNVAELHPGTGRPPRSGPSSSAASIEIVSADRPDDDSDRRQWRAAIRAQLAQHKPSAAADFDTQRFVECAACGQKPGSPTLCAGCLANRQTIDELRDRRAELTLQIAELTKRDEQWRIQTDALKKIAAEREERLQKPRYAGQPDRCPVCEWSNGDLLNYGEPGKPRWMCHPCAARALGDVIDRGFVERVYKTLGTLSLVPGLDRPVWASICTAQSELASALGRAVDRRSSTIEGLYSGIVGDSPQAGRSDPPLGVAVQNTDAPDFKDAATLSLVELAHRLFRQIPSGLDWDGSHEWRIAMGVWQSRYHALLGAQPAPPKIKHRFALARSRAGLSIGQAAKILGVDRKVLETAEESPETDAAFVRQMAEKYQVNIPWLVGETPLRDYAAMAGARGYEHVSDHDRDVIAEFAASLPRGAISKKAQELRDKIRGARLPSPDEANAELKKLLGEDES